MGGFWICLRGQGVNFSGKISGFREKERKEKWNERERKKMERKAVM